MDLLLLQPLMLWAAAALAAPLLLHLMKRRRRDPVPFPSLLLLHRARLSSARRVRIENLLLWLLRTLLLACLVAAFCLPVLRFGGLPGFGGAVRRDVAIVFDNSLAMTRRLGGESAAELARRAALELIDGLREGDRVVLVFAADAVPLTPGPTADFAAVRDALVAARPGNTEARLGDALAAAVAALGESAGREREIQVLTDGRACAWPDRPVVSGKAGGIPCFALLVAGGDADNVWIADLAPRPATPVPGRPCEAVVRLGRSGAAGDVVVTLTASGGAPVSRTVPAGLASVVIPLPAPAPGPLTLRATVPGDALAADDVAEAVVAVRERPPVVVFGPARETAALRLALDPFGRGASVVPVGDGEPVPDLTGAEAVFLVGGDHDTPRMRALEAFVRDGGALVIFPGPGAAPLPVLSEALAPAPVTGVDLFASDAAATRLIRTGAPATRILDDALPAGAPAPALGVRRAVRFGRIAPGASVLLTLGDDRPCLVRRACGRGVVFLSAIGADRSWSTAPLGTWFLPCVQRLAVAAPGAVRAALPPGASGPPGVVARGLAARPDLFAPDGAPAPVSASGELGPLRLPGVYTTGGPAPAGRPVFAVARCVTGSDLTPLNPDDIPKRTGLSRVKSVADGASHREAVAAHREGVPMAEPLLWAVLLLAIAEWLVANRVAARRSSGAERSPA